MTEKTTESGDDRAHDEQVPEMTATPIDHDENIRDTDVADDAASDDDARELTDSGDATAATSTGARRRVDWSRVIAYGVLPALALILVIASGFLKWKDTTNRDAQTARVESVQVARDSTVALLSYTPADVDKQLVAARDRLTGEFKNSYTSLTNDVVIPGAKEQQITAVATVPAAASVTATVNHAVALLFVNQTTTVGTGRPTDLASTVRVTMEKVNGHWLISQFDPV